MFFTGGYQRDLSFYDHLGMMEKVQHLGDVVSAGMFQMVTVFTARPQTAWQVEGHYQEVSFMYLYTYRDFLFNVEYSIWPMLLYLLSFIEQYRLVLSYCLVCMIPVSLNTLFAHCFNFSLNIQNLMKSYIPIVMGRLKNCIVFIKQKLFVWSLLQDWLACFTWLVDSDCFSRALYST